MPSAARNPSASAVPLDEGRDLFYRQNIEREKL
jgi:hypothetical protein